jgi:hypothetical protein
MPSEFVIHCPRIVFDRFNAAVNQLPPEQAQAVGNAIDMFLWAFRDSEGQHPRVDLTGPPRLLVQPTRGSFTSGGVRIDFARDRTLDPSPVVVLSITVAPSSP